MTAQGLGQPFALDHVEPGRLVSLTGRLDVHAAADARLALADAVENGEGDLVIDLIALEALDATGLGVLVGAHRCAGRAGRTLVLRDVQPLVGRLLFLSKLDRVLRVETTDAA
ncbi:MAG: STAS domain-containing protein [Mycobacteriales bacterium]